MSPCVVSKCCAYMASALDSDFSYIFHTREVEADAGLQEFIVCYHSVRLIVSLPALATRAECCIHSTPHSTVQSCVQEAQHAGSEIPEVFLSASLHYILIKPPESLMPAAVLCRLDTRICAYALFIHINIYANIYIYREFSLLLSYDVSLWHAPAHAQSVSSAHSSCLSLAHALPLASAGARLHSR